MVYHQKPIWAQAHDLQAEISLQQFPSLDQDSINSTKCSFKTTLRLTMSYMFRLNEKCTFEIVLLQVEYFTAIQFQFTPRRHNCKLYF